MEKLNYLIFTHNYIYELKKEYGIRIKILVFGLAALIALDVAIIEFFHGKGNTLYTKSYEPVVIIIFSICFVTLVGFIIYSIWSVDEDKQSPLSTFYISSYKDFNTYYNENLAFLEFEKSDGTIDIGKKNIYKEISEEIYANAKVHRKRSKRIKVTLWVLLTNFSITVIVLIFLYLKL
jgi:hypothetical protein